MAIAFGRGAQAQQGASAPASPIVVTVTVNANETGLAAITLVGATPGSVTAGPTGWTLQRVLRNGTSKIELWGTLAGGAPSAASLSFSFNGTNDAVELQAVAYTGVLSYGNTTTAQGTAANPTISLATQDANNFVVAAFGIASTAVTVAPTTGTGNIREADAVSAAGVNDSASAVNDNTSAGAGNVTNTVTYSVGSSTWAAVAIELRTVLGTLLQDTAHSPQHQSLIAQ